MIVFCDTGYNAWGAPCQSKPLEPESSLSVGDCGVLSCQERCSWQSNSCLRSSVSRNVSFVFVREQRLTFKADPIPDDVKRVAAELEALLRCGALMPLRCGAAPKWGGLRRAPMLGSLYGAHRTPALRQGRTAAGGTPWRRHSSAVAPQQCLAGPRPFPTRPQP